MKAIDFRSDTVTWPTPAMREAMANAAVGDDVLGDDPTVLELEAEAAAMLGKEAGLLVVSGTMGNVVSTLTHCGRADEMIVGRHSHIITYEVGSHSAYGGIHPMPLAVQPDGTLDLDEIRQAIRTENDHYPTTRLICLENTQGSRGGMPVSAEYTHKVAEIARKNGLKLHIDGARIFNAAAALNTPVDELVAGADSVTFCLSKGLCAPVGSVIVGSRDFIRRARRVRKSLGGGMRQAGVLAAPGLIALREMSRRVGEDHLTTRMMAEGLARIPYVRIDLDRVKTNMMYFSLNADSPLTPAQLTDRLKAEYNILISSYDATHDRFRVVTHYYITPDHVEQALDAIQTLLGVREIVRD